MTELADIDRQLDELGPVPEDLAELLARYGEDDRSEQHLDSLLSSLGQGVEDAAVEALGVESVPAPAAPPPEPDGGDGDREGDGAAVAQAAEPAPAASDFAIARDTDVDRPATPLEAEAAPADEVDEDLQAAPELDALFDAAPAGAAVPQHAEDEDDVEMSFDDAGDLDAELGAATDGLFDTLEDAEPVSSVPEAETDLGDPELTEDPDTALSAAPDTEARKSDLKALLREEMDPSDFPQTPSSAPPAPPALADDGAAADAAGDDDFELLVDEDDIEEIEIDDDELELLDD